MEYNTVDLSVVGFFVALSLLLKIVGAIGFYVFRKTPVISVRSPLLIALYIVSGFVDALFMGFQAVGFSHCLSFFVVWKVVIPRWTTWITLEILRLFLLYKRNTNKIYAALYSTDDEDNDTKASKHGRCNYSWLPWAPGKDYTDTKGMLKLLLILYIFQLIFPALSVIVNPNDICSDGSILITGASGILRLVPIPLLIILLWSVEDAHFLKRELKWMGLFAIPALLFYASIFIESLESVWGYLGMIAYHSVCDILVLIIPCIIAYKSENDTNSSLSFRTSSSSDFIDMKKPEGEEGQEEKTVLDITQKEFRNVLLHFLAKRYDNVRFDINKVKLWEAIIELEQRLDSLPNEELRKSMRTSGTYMIFLRYMKRPEDKTYIYVELPDNLYTPVEEFANEFGSLETGSDKDIYIDQGKLKDIKDYLQEDINRNAIPLFKNSKDYETFVHSMSLNVV